MKETIKLINLTIVSMVTKQQVLDELKNDLFNIDIYRGYINNLIDANLQLMNLNSKDKYKQLITDYIEGKFDHPDEIIRILMK